MRKEKTKKNTRREKIDKKAISNGFFEHGDHIHVFNLECAAVLILLHFEFAIENEGRRTFGPAYFVFKRNKEILKAINNYFSDKLLIDTQNMSLYIKKMINGFRSKPKKQNITP